MNDGIIKRNSDPVVTMGSLLCSYGIFSKECIFMRTIRDILSEEERVWLYFDTEELCRQFYEETDLRFGDLPKEKWQTGYVIGAHSDGTMGHLSLYVWCRSFSSDSPTIPKRIDYRKFINGESDYYCTKSHFRAAVSAK